MSRASNSLKISDVLTTPIKLKYSASYESGSFSNYGIAVNLGSNGVVTSAGSIPASTLTYRSVRHLYYSNYLSGPFPSTTSSLDNYLQSTAASGTLDVDLRYFPTDPDATVIVLSIPRQLYGEKISRKSFLITGSYCRVVDDGNGNLVDQFTDPNLYVDDGYVSGGYYIPPPPRLAGAHVGNIFYAQGIAVITNPLYQTNILL